MRPGHSERRREDAERRRSVGTAGLCRARWVPTQCQPAACVHVSLDLDAGRDCTTVDLAADRHPDSEPGPGDHVSLVDPGRSAKSGPDQYGGTVAVGVARLHGVYVAVGDVDAGCCDGNALAPNRGVVWTSSDGRNWDLHDQIPAFAGATLGGLLGDDDRIFAYGLYAPPAGGTNSPADPAVWVSSDGFTWTRSSGLAPDFVAIGPEGLVGITVESHQDASLDDIRFLRSADGLQWTVTSDNYQALIRGIAAAPDGSAMALGFVPGAPLPDGTRTPDLTAFRSPDGSGWSGPAVVEHNAQPTRLVAVPGGYAVVVFRLAEDTGGSIASTYEVWRLPGSAGPQAGLSVAPPGSVDRLLVADDAVIAVGTTGPVGGPLVFSMWVSTDGGATFGRVPDQSVFADLRIDPMGIIGTPGGLLAVGGAYKPASNEPTFPVAWLASR